MQDENDDKEDYGLYAKSLEKREPEIIATHILSGNAKLKMRQVSSWQIPRVLVVDDYFYNLNSITTLLRQYSIEADIATDGNEALDRVKKLY